jgi:type IV pilus assembly protein PilE
MKFTNFKKRQRGMNLIELLVVVAIVAILGAFAYPSYVQHIVDTKRTAATSMLLQVADRQQQFFMDNKTYAADLTNLGFGANPLVVGDDGREVPAGDMESVYSVTLANVGVTTYTATAAPLNGQLSRDTECGSLALDQSSNRTQSGAATDCWN